MAVAALGALTSPGAALGGVVTETQDGFAFTAHAGEHNELSLLFGDGGVRATIYDSESAELVAYPPNLSPDSTRCLPYPVNAQVACLNLSGHRAVSLSLGDGDDVLQASGSPAPDFDVSDGAGFDRLYTAEGDDRLRVSDGLADDGWGSVVWQAGAGTDTADFGALGQGIRFDIRESFGNAGAPNLSAQVVGVEKVIGTRFDDIFSGDYDSAQADVFETGAGDDQIYPRGGDDQIGPGAGADTVLAESGDDVITLGFDWAADTIDCGEGEDTVVRQGEPDPQDTFVNCETVVEG